jgi:hypothetical protein
MISKSYNATTSTPELGKETKTMDEYILTRSLPPLLSSCEMCLCVMLSAKEVAVLPSPGFSITPNDNISFPAMSSV